MDLGEINWVNITYLTVFALSIVTAYDKQSDGRGLPAMGVRARCINEGMVVSVDDIDTHRCYSCICKNGFVECSNHCPRFDECHMIVEDGCCKRCKGCMYNGSFYQSHSEWPNATNPCKVLRCEAGVITESELLCHTPCANPLPLEPGKCCPTCPECKINGQITSDDRYVIHDYDPCLKCGCVKGKMTCSKKACPVLQCPPIRQHHIPGECCPRCKGTRALLTANNTCALQTSVFKEGDRYTIDKCTNCSCKDQTSVCYRITCPILDCASEFQEPDGRCCKKCKPPAELRFQCNFMGKSYEEGQQWKLDSCKSCKCHNGMPSCAITRCNNTCPVGSKSVEMKGECCHKCVEVEGVCMVFGDPHYKTFDGKMYSFKGVGKYQLISDCRNNSFSIKVANENKMSSLRTKRVAVRYSNIRLNLQQKGRVKYNGARITPPFKLEGIFRIDKVNDILELTLQNGVKLFWNGKSYLEVSVPAQFKNSTCGLCGNFNSIAQDDLMTKEGIEVSDKDIMNFGRSWCVGKKSDCEKKNRHLSKSICGGKHRPERSCKYLSSHLFSACDSQLNYIKYYRACKMDMCDCPRGKCYCDSLLAYARECSRLGVVIDNWQKDTYCDNDSLKRSNRNLAQTHRYHKKTFLLNYPKKINLSGIRSSKSPLPLL